MDKSLNLNINPLVILIADIIECGKNAVYKAKDVAYRLLQSATHNQSLEAMFKLTGYLSADRVLEHLHSLSEENILRIIKKINKKLVLPRKVNLAVDFHDREYYGDKNHKEIIGSKGGKYVRRFIELSCVNFPLFLNSYMVNQFNNNSKRLLNKLLDDFYALYNKKINLLLADRGFFTKTAVNMLVRRKIPFIIPAKKDRSIKKLIELFKKGKLNARIRYKFGRYYVALAFLKVEDDVYVYATNTNHTPLKLCLLYTKRWQIETNFREQNKFSILTKTRDFDVRYFAFVIAGLLFNAWQITRKKLRHIKESYLYKQILIEELLREWIKTGKKVVRNLDYFLVA